MLKESIWGNVHVLLRQMLTPLQTFSSPLCKSEIAYRTGEHYTLFKGTL